MISIIRASENLSPTFLSSFPFSLRPSFESISGSCWWYSFIGRLRWRKCLMSLILFICSSVHLYVGFSVCNTRYQKKLISSFIKWNNGEAWFLEKTFWWVRKALKWPKIEVLRFWQKSNPFAYIFFVNIKVLMVF